MCVCNRLLFSFTMKKKKIHLLFFAGDEEPPERMVSLTNRNSEFQETREICQKAFVGHTLGLQFSDVEISFEEKGDCNSKSEKSKRKGDSLFSEKNVKKRRIE